MIAGSRSSRHDSAATVKILGEPLAQLLGETLPVDVLAHVGFRFLGVPAWIDRSALTARVQRFRNTSRVDGTLARKGAIRTIRDGHVAPDSVLQDVSRLTQTRSRFIAELFWPHLSETDFAIVGGEGSLGAAAIQRAWSGGTGTPRARVLRTHSLALSRWCHALERELDFIEDQDKPPAGAWESALDTWRDVWRSEEFWTYLHTRVADLDDPTLLAEDVERVRRELPAVLLGMHVMLAEHFAERGDDANCRRHLGLIRVRRFSEDDCRTAMLAAVKRVGGSRLDGLVLKATQALAALNAQCSRSAFEQVVRPLLGQVQDVRRLLTERFALPDYLLGHLPFDQFADAIRSAANSKLDYSGDDRQRNILYSSLVCRQLLALPLSTACRHATVATMRNDNRILYQDYADPQPDALDCFFAPGQQADPDASLVLPMYRIVERTVSVNTATGGTGVRIKFEKVGILVPRSTLAKRHGSNGGQVTIETPASDYSDRQRDCVRKLRELEIEQGRQRTQLQASGDSRIRGTERQNQSELDAFERRAAVTLKDAQRGIDRTAGHEEQQLAAERQRLEGEQQRVQKAHEPQLQAARTSAEVRQRTFRGLGGYGRLEAPLFSVAFVAGWLATSDPVAAAVVAFVVGMVIGRVVRTRIAASARRVVVAAEAKQAAALKELEDDSATRIRALQQTAKQERARWQSVIDGVKNERARLQHAAQGRLASARGELQSALQQAEQTTKQQSEVLRKELVRVITIRKESEKTAFGPYAGARRKGFKDGSEPDYSDQQMTAAERREAERLLRRGF